MVLVTNVNVEHIYVKNVTYYTVYRCLISNLSNDMIHNVTIDVVLEVHLDNTHEKVRMVINLSDH